MKLETGDILFIEGTGLISRLIIFASKCKYSHVAFVYNENIALVIESIRTGVRAVSLKNYFLNTKGKITVKRCLDLTKDQKQIMSAISLDLLGKQYDFDQLIKSKKDKDEQIICSELIEIIYQSVNIDLLQESGKVTPKSLSHDQRLTWI